MAGGLRRGAYLDQLGRSNGLPAARIDAARRALATAEGQSGSARRSSLNRLAGELDSAAAGSSDQARVRATANVTRQLAGKS